MTSKNLERNITFKDSEGVKCRLEIKIEDGNFSISGSRAGGGGQIQDHIKPRTQAQEALLKWWETYHLNDMNAGTKKQEEFLKDNNLLEVDYTDQVEALEKAGLYNDNGYKYGSGWIKEDLPALFVEDLEELINKIEKEEGKEKKDKDIFNLMEEEGIDEGNKEACEAYLEAFSVDNLKEFEESYQGKFKNKEEFAIDMAEGIGAIDTNVNWPSNCIDWEQASKELMIDYTEQDGHYFRN